MTKNKGITKELAGKVFVGMLAQFDLQIDIEKSHCYAIQFIHEKKLFTQYLHYLKRNLK